MIIKTSTPARAGLIGNPSDGYFGKTISFTVRNFEATVICYESPFIEIKLGNTDKLAFPSIGEFMQKIEGSGYYGGIRLIKATIKIFHEYCKKNNIKLHDKNFTISYSSNIPTRVGMAGSSAIVTSAMKALMAFYDVKIEKPILANLILSVEKDELKIGAGLQDRVIQVYEDIVYMDFNKENFEKTGTGIYEKLNIPEEELPNFYIAYSQNLSEGTEVFHNNIRERYNYGEKKVVDAMEEFANITTEFKKALLSNDVPMMNKLINANFDLRSQIYNISKENKNMINLAREFGASSKFCGSGGAIVGIYKNELLFDGMREAFKRFNIVCFKPQIYKSNELKVEKTNIIESQSSIFEEAQSKDLNITLQ